jgi:hypothetical protein
MHDRQLAMIWPLLGRHIAFHRRLVDLTENVKAALLLSQTIYWTRHGRDIARTGGWFVKTTQQWEMETGLSAKEQRSAREVLREIAVLSEQRIGIPAKLHYRLSIDELGALLFDRSGRGCARLDWSDGAAVVELLGPSLAYHRRLAAIGGGVHAGLLLSRALHLTRLQSKRQVDPCVHISAMQWCEELGLTRRELETARRDLARVGVWHETLAGVPPTLVARVKQDVLLALLAQDVTGSGHRIAVEPSPDHGLPAQRIAQNGASRGRQSHRLVPPKAPKQFDENCHHSSVESAHLHIQVSTSDSVQPLRANPGADGHSTSQWGGGLIFPATLLPEERACALLLVKPCAGQAQALLDELSARMQANAIHTSPIAYLRGLVMRAHVGEFMPELGQRVAAARRNREQERVERQLRAAEEQRLAQERAAPEYQAKLAARREEIQRMLAVMRADRPPRERA